MSVLEFDYSMKMEYEKEATGCYFTLKCLPGETHRQKVEKLNYQIRPSTYSSEGKDGLGNRKIIGSVQDPHRFFEFHLAGQIRIDEYLYEEKACIDNLAMYRYPTRLTSLGPALSGCSKMLKKELRDGSDYNRALALMHRLHETFGYEKERTQVQTTAEEAYSMGKGVCQDYAHIFLTLCRDQGIPARYAAGLMTGEGQSHAWAEVMVGGLWIGMDPTNDWLVDDHYVKFCHGRDASDCKLNLGILYNGGGQKQTVLASSRFIEE